MNQFDAYLRKKVTEEPVEIPNHTKEAIAQTLTVLPERTGKVNKARKVQKITAIAACFLFICLVVLPNVSTVYAQTLEKIPILRTIVKVVAGQNLTYADEYHEMQIEIPQIEGDAAEAVTYINKDIAELTTILAERFEQDRAELGNQAHTGLYVNYDVVTNTDTWFTLKICVQEDAGSGNTYYRYYHIDKLRGTIVQLGDLAASDAFYDVVKEEIKRQMREQMESDSRITYWVDDPIFGKNFLELDAAHNFYWNDAGELVIVFDKYEVAPGAMRTPEFAIQSTLLQEVLRPEYRS